ncbi:Prefoldin [Fimicolochytrium jonesii]|uniref:Prefoldin n=1 Tax=Fimicolochytrium jonesii TaxID=1396493 RepID=UPI0022FEFDB1|nr:Prefoldin [Fimicolochytrium jonesii]KAI8815792.1 Prefoldin [Fimicolochytrium jonesii]
MATSSNTSEKRPSDQEIVSQLNSMKQEMNAIAQKLGELEMEKDEHQLVVDTMKPLEGDRKCFRLVGGVLVERTVKDVLPAVETNMDGIANIIKQLVTQYKKKEQDFEAFQKKWGVQIKNQ